MPPPSLLLSLLLSVSPLPSHSLQTFPANLPVAPASADPLMTKAKTATTTLAMGLESTTAWLNLLLAKTGGHSRQQKVWIGNGLPAIPMKVHEKIVNWEYVELAELRLAGTLDTLNRETEAQKCIIMPGLEITQANCKPIKDISTWVQHSASQSI